MPMPMRCFVHAVCDSNVLMDEAELAVLHRLGQVHLTNTAPMPRRAEPSRAEPASALLGYVCDIPSQLQLLTIIVPFAVLRELDGLKNSADSHKRCASARIRSASASSCRAFAHVPTSVPALDERESPACLRRWIPVTVRIAAIRAIHFVHAAFTSRATWMRGQAAHEVRSRAAPPQLSSTPGRWGAPSRFAGASDVIADTCAVRR